MKTNIEAEKRAEKMAFEMSGRAWMNHAQWMGWAPKFIAQALTEFAREAVEKAWGRDDLDHFERVQKQGFKEGAERMRERAAKVAESNMESNHIEDIPREIRAFPLLESEKGE